LKIVDAGAAEAADDIFTITVTTTSVTGATVS